MFNYWQINGVEYWLIESLRQIGKSVNAHRRLTDRYEVKQCKGVTWLMAEPTSLPTYKSGNLKSKNNSKNI